MWSHILAALVGIWIMLAPSVLGYEDTAAEYSHRIAGPLIVTFSTIAAWQVLRGVRVASVVAGGWLVVAPLLLAHAVPSAMNSVLSGLVVMGLSTIRGRITTRYGGGWRVLFTRRSDP